MKSLLHESLLSDKRILILGASGQIGRHLTATLRRLAPGSQLVLQSRHPQEVANEAWLQFDPKDEKWPEMGHFDLLINAAGAMYPTPGSSLHDLHLGIAQGILRNLDAIGQPRLIHISALNAAKGHRSKFLDSKGQADELLLNYPNCIILRPSIVCTKGTMLAQKLGQVLYFAKIALGKLMVPKGFLGTKVQPVLASDLSEAILRLAAPDAWAADRILELGGPLALEFGELIKIMAEAKDQSYRPIELPKEILEGFVRYFMDVWAPSVLSLDQFFLLFEDNICPPNALEHLLGRPPKTTEEFWRQEARGLKECDESADWRLNLA